MAELPIYIYTYIYTCNKNETETPNMRILLLLVKLKRQIWRQNYVTKFLGPLPPYTFQIQSPGRPDDFKGQVPL